MVHFLQFDYKPGGGMPVPDGASLSGVLGLLRITDVAYVYSASQDSNALDVYYNNMYAAGSAVSGRSSLGRTRVNLVGAQSDYNFLRWLNDQIKAAHELGPAGPPVLRITSEPPVLVEYMQNN